MPVVANNATVVDIQRLGSIPLKIGRERLPSRYREHP